MGYRAQRGSKKAGMLVIGAMAATIGVALIPIYVMPLLDPTPYGKLHLCLPILRAMSEVLKQHCAAGQQKKFLEERQLTKEEIQPVGECVRDACSVSGAHSHTVTGLPVWTDPFKAKK
jgi:hypothetical protein